MERHIGLWARENSGENEVAELIINGNQIEFYKRGRYDVFSCAFVGSDDNHNYKVFTNGSTSNGKNKTLKNATSYKTACVLQQNCAYKPGMEIEGITAASFTIPELIDWIDVTTIDLGATKEKMLVASEVDMPSIILKNGNPQFEIFFESKSSLFGSNVDIRTTFIIENQPRIRITYEKPTNYSCLYDDIKSIMQFFALLIGRVSDVLDIRLDIADQSCKSWLYINQDFSYNLKTETIIDKPRTKLLKIGENIQTYFENWYNFYLNEKFDFIRKMYFVGNSKKDFFVEDIFVLYVRILEGYHLRITDDENVASIIDKDIKKMIFTEEGKNLFQPIFEKADWKFNSEHADRVSSWIASGFLSRISLESRLKKLDNMFFNIIAMNADKMDAADYYKQIVSTRNYYSHYKAKKENVFEFNLMCDTINVLKALIIMLLYSHMGIPKEEIRKIIMWDSELNFQTMCLRKEGETPDS